MSILDIFKREDRATLLPNGSVPVSSSNFATIFNGFFGGTSASGVVVNTEVALGQPSIWAAVNFLSGTLAGMPLHVYRKTKDNRTRLKTGVAPILSKAINDEMSSFEWRKGLSDQGFTGGRGLSYIERPESGKILNIWPLDATKITIKRVAGRKSYEYKDGNKTIVYSASEILDIPFMLRNDGLGHYGPIATMKDAIGLAIAATNYGSRFFQNGGVPPFVMTGNFETPAGLNRAPSDLNAAVKKAAHEDRLAQTLPAGHDIKQIGDGPEKSQLVELQRFSIEQVARMYSLPPTFLQDLTHGTFSNTEQQDLHFVKHTVKRWVEQFEQELNLKLFGRGNTRLYVEFNMDGLLRGDFKTRMEGYATGIQNSILKPNEVRRRENMPDDPAGDKLMIQGATVSTEQQLALPLGETNAE